jgi:hypothetical protein
MRKIFGGSWHTGKQLILFQSTGRTGSLLDHKRKAESVDAEIHTTRGHGP